MNKLAFQPADRVPAMPNHYVNKWGRAVQIPPNMPPHYAACVRLADAVLARAEHRARELSTPANVRDVLAWDAMQPGVYNTIPGLPRWPNVTL